MLLRENGLRFKREVLKSEKSVIVCFYSYWSEASIDLLDFLKTFASENPEYKVYGVNCAKSPKLVKKYKITAFPALVLYKGGYEVKRNFGIQNEATLKYFLEEK
ncbi:MAG: thioredoxin family protein [Acholeplasmataceae bacterium]|nr:thioredoxin family protein [Acholeplasmataceae bacterium]